MKVYQVVDDWWEYENEGRGGYTALGMFASAELAENYIRKIDVNDNKPWQFGTAINGREELTVKDKITGEGLSTVRSIEYISPLRPRHCVIFKYSINELEVIEV